MKWPALLNVPLVNKDGMMNAQWLMFFEQMTSGLNESISDNGIALPNANNEIVSNLLNNKDGTMLYDIENKQPKIKVNGIIKTIVTS